MCRRGGAPEPLHEGLGATAGQQRKSWPHRCMFAAPAWLLLRLRWPRLIQVRNSCFQSVSRWSKLLDEIKAERIQYKMTQNPLRLYLDALLHGSGGRFGPGVIEVLRHGVRCRCRPPPPEHPFTRCTCAFPSSSGLGPQAASHLLSYRRAPGARCASPACGPPCMPSRRQTRTRSVRPSWLHAASSTGLRMRSQRSRSLRRRDPTMLQQPKAVAVTQNVDLSRTGAPTVCQQVHQRSRQRFWLEVRTARTLPRPTTLTDHQRPPYLVLMRLMPLALNRQQTQASVQRQTLHKAMASSSRTAQSGVASARCAWASSRCRTRRRLCPWGPQGSRSPTWMPVAATGGSCPRGTSQPSQPRQGKSLAALWTRLQLKALLPLDLPYKSQRWNPQPLISMPHTCVPATLAQHTSSSLSIRSGSRTACTLAM